MGACVCVREFGVPLCGMRGWSGGNTRLFYIHVLKIKKMIGICHGSYIYTDIKKLYVGILITVSPLDKTDQT